MSQSPPEISPLTQIFKLKVFNHYGLYCHHPDGCDITDISDLCLDHVHNNGAEQRAKGLRGIRLYKYILGMAKSDTPVWDDYTVLCYTHNHGRQIKRYAEERLEQTHTTTPHHTQKSLRTKTYMSEGRLQINSSVSPEVYSYLKTQKAERNISEKQILQEMYESHVKGHMSGLASHELLKPYLEEQFAKVHERLTAQRELTTTQLPQELPAVPPEMTPVVPPWSDPAQWEAWQVFKQQWDAQRYQDVSSSPSWRWIRWLWSWAIT